MTDVHPVWLRLPIMLTLVFSVTLATVAECVASASETAQMACCVAGHHDCATMGNSSSCCETTNPSDPQRFIAAKKDAPDVLLAPAALPIAASWGLPDLVRYREFRERPPRAPATPTHLRLSVLLI